MSYQPGSFFVVDVPGRAGWWIGIAQALAGNASRYKHAGLILDADGTILEGEPHGARLANIAEYTGHAVQVCDGPILNLPAEEQDAARARVVAEGFRRKGTKYSWLDYAAIGLLRLPVPIDALRRYVASTKHAQCAQLVDLIYRACGIHLFTDPVRREEGDVMPADLAAYAEDWRAHGD